MNKPMLDIIVTYHDELLETGRKFFDMLRLQRDVDFDNFRVIIVHDDSAKHISDFSMLLGETSYTYIIENINKHVGTAEARNVGLRKSTAEWVMFCDFDDLFTNVCALKLIIDVLPSNKADVGWFETWIEEKQPKHFVNVLKENITSTNGKVYRRSILIDNDIFFEPSLKHLYESEFNAHAFSVIPQHRIAKISMPFAAYMKTFRDDGFNSNEGALNDIMNEMLMLHVFSTNRAIKEHRMTDAGIFFMDALFDAYFVMNNSHAKITEKNRTAFINFIRSAWTVVPHVDWYTVDASMTNAGARMDNFVQKAYIAYGAEMLPPMHDLSIAIQWIRNTFGIDLEKTCNTIESLAEHSSDRERIVVYCGTKNTYEYMSASAKSLLAHTKVDRVYFLTEDDTFPESLPDIITNINVSGQTYFDPSGPNYKNSWTYMCLMRAAFTKLFPKHSCVLSLDNDTVVTQDISELFDTDMTDYYIAGVHEIKRTQEDYINFGVVLMNLDLLRSDRLDDKIISELNENIYDCPEQTVFSELCEHHIKLLPTEYNFVIHSTLTGACDHPKIVHYAGIKYWKHYDGYRKYKDMSWKDVMNRQVNLI